MGETNSEIVKDSPRISRGISKTNNHANERKKKNNENYQPL